MRDSLTNWFTNLSCCPRIPVRQRLPLRGTLLLTALGVDTMTSSSEKELQPLDLGTVTCIIRDDKARECDYFKLSRFKRAELPNTRFTKLEQVNFVDLSWHISHLALHGTNYGPSFERGEVDFYYVREHGLKQRAFRQITQDYHWTVALADQLHGLGNSTGKLEINIYVVKKGASPLRFF